MIYQPQTELHEVHRATFHLAVSASTSILNYKQETTQSFEEYQCRSPSSHPTVLMWAGRERNCPWPTWKTPPWKWTRARTKTILRHHPTTLWWASTSTWNANNLSVFHYSRKTVIPFGNNLFILITYFTEHLPRANVLIYIPKCRLVSSHFIEGTLRHRDWNSLKIIVSRWRSWTLSADVLALEILMLTSPREPLLSCCLGLRQGLLVSPVFVSFFFF